MSSLDVAGACPPPAGSPDGGVAWHYGDPLREQRWLAGGEAVVDLSHRGVVTVTGPDRLSWLHDLTTAYLLDLPVGESRLALILDPHGRVEHELHLVDDGVTTWMTVEPGTAGGLVEYLNRMRFLRRVEVESRDLAVVGSLGERHRDLPEVEAHWVVPPEFAGTGTTPAGVDLGGGATRYVPRRPGVFPAHEFVVPKESLTEALTVGPLRAGTWAWEALRVAAGVPRLGMETDSRTLPHEVGWIGSAVHLAKGCYRGQEAVARTHNMGRPPRRLVLLHLDLGDTHLPRHGEPVTAEGRQVGWIGTAVQHFEIGPLASAVVKRSVSLDAPLVVAGPPATQEPVVVVD